MSNPKKSAAPVAATLAHEDELLSLQELIAESADDPRKIAHLQVLLDMLRGGKQNPLERLSRCGWESELGKLLKRSAS